MGLVGNISLTLGLLSYLALTTFCFYTWYRGITGRALAFASVMTLTWLLTAAFADTAIFFLAAEPLALIGWIVLLVRALGLSPKTLAQPSMRQVAWTFAVASTLAGVATLAIAAAANDILSGGVGGLVYHLALVVTNVLALVLVEQLARNAISDYRWRLRYLTIGLSIVFAYGLIHHALAILTAQPIALLVALQPAVMALLTPFIVVASLRNSTNQLKFSLSRTFVFRTGVLVASGAFLLALGLFGYIAQIFAGEIGTAIAVFGSICALAFFIVVLGSTRIRSQLRVQLAKTFFEYRYDYRDEWMQVTAQITEPSADFTLAQQAQRALLSVLHAKCAGLWMVQGPTQSWLPYSHVDAPQWNAPLDSQLAKALTAFYSEYDWVLDLNHMPEEANKLAQALKHHPESNQLRFVVPLFVQSDLVGVCFTGESEALDRLVWEDFDVIKLIAKQCASVLALEQANINLVEQEQLAAVNQMSAFLLHDIKTITAQLSLLVENAERHKANPDFIDDMINTTKNSVLRMQKIMQGLQESEQNDKPAAVPINLQRFLKDRSSSHASQPVKYSYCEQPLYSQITEMALDTALTHIEHNAIEATAANGKDTSVAVTLREENSWGFIEITDQGVGMSEAFIQEQLFTPFKSSKGLSGMGIGAYQARTNIREFGGDLQVQSKVGLGTTFTIKLPLVSA